MVAPSATAGLFSNTAFFIQCMDAWHGHGSNVSTDGSPMVRLLAEMDALSHAGALAPPMLWDSSVIKKKPGAKQRNAIQRLRDVLVCVRSEAARFGPERCVPSTLRVLLCLEHDAESTTVPRSLCTYLARPSSVRKCCG